MAGIYIHIPFCRQACYYCDFHFSTSLKSKDDLLQALQKEIALQKNYFADNKALKSVYFGGGTPSLLSPGEIRDILDNIFSAFRVEPTAEVTLEVNPDDLFPAKLKGFKDAGINRLSIGIQSFFSEDLKWMNRAHTSEQAYHSIKDSLDAGFENLTIDLIYGFPLLTNEKWEKNLLTAMESGVQHLSCYALTVEPRTALAHFIASHQQRNIDEHQQAEHLQILMDMAEAHGFEQYEISNFARAGKYSVHNSSYWKGEKYLGIGPSAHSFDGASRQWNVRNNSQYIQSLHKDIIPFEKEILTEANKFNEYVLLSLRTAWGIDIHELNRKFGMSRSERFMREVENIIQKGLMENQKEKMVLTKEGRFFADRLAAELFQD